jgi:hypothetical protein
MEVLGVLTRHAGRVVPREELLDAVWPGVIVTEHTLSRCIYQLRHELGKIGTGPGDAEQQFIETLPKRGYRLVAHFETAPAKTSTAPAWQSPELSAIPYVVGQWVRGERFYGRSAQMAEILDGHRNAVWLLGTRRIGKTSLLKQIEYIAGATGDHRYFPIFWDFQGAETAEELHVNFADALLDAEERFERIGIAPEEVESDDLFVSIERLRRRLRDRKLGLLLLCDEVEQLIALHQKDPALLRKLRHVMQSRDDIRTVLASTIRLWVLAEQKEDTSPFLHGFTPPLYIERLTDEEADALIEQTHLAPGERPRFGRDVVEAIRERCDNHPYLLQLVCKRYLESGELDAAIEQVATDRMVSYFFSVDFDMLSEEEGDILRMIARQSAMGVESVRGEFSLASDDLAAALQRLQNLGFMRKDSRGRFMLTNYFFRRWLQQSNGKKAAAEAADPLPLEKQRPTVISDEQTRHGFVAELKRRKVFRVGIAYIVVAWITLQMGEILFDFLEVPSWAGKLLVVFLALGLPVALILAWAFELTPEGIKRDRDVNDDGPRGT